MSEVSTPPAGDRTPSVGSPIVFWKLRGSILIGPRLRPRSEHAVQIDPDLREVFRTPVAPDTVISFLDGVDATLLDLDTHHWSAPPFDQELQADLGSIVPAPAIAWVSHGRGLKLLYNGPHHRASAMAAVLAIPPKYKLDIVPYTYHPLTTRPDKPGSVCGAVWFNEEFNPTIPHEFRRVGQVTDAVRESALAELGFERGSRYDHDRCPIDPGSGDAVGSVLPLDNGVYCYRCAARGIRYRPSMSPGFLPYSVLAGAECTDLDNLVLSRVHWVHARHVLKHVYPNLSDRTLEECYRLALETAYPAERNPEGKPDAPLVPDPRIWGVFRKELNFIRGEAGWIDAGTFSPRVIDNDEADALPYVQTSKWLKGERLVSVDRLRRGRVKHSIGEGYKPVRVYRGLAFNRSGGEIVPVLVPSRRRKIELPERPMSLGQIREVLDASFPAINFTYFQAALVAGICADADMGRPPMLCVSGPSGAGKEQTVRLAASCLDDEPVKVQIEDPAEFTRGIGAGLSEGRRFVLVDEMGKVSKLAKKFGQLLQIGSTLTWRPLWSHPITVPMRCAIFFPSVNFPEWLKSAREFTRRTRYLRLSDASSTPWEQTCGGDCATWRERGDKARAHAMNSAVHHAYTLAVRHGFQWEAAADELGLGRLSDETSLPAEELDRICCELYAITCGHIEGRTLIEGHCQFKKGWTDLAKPRAAELIESWLDLENHRSMRSAMMSAKHNLESLNWNKILRIKSPSIHCRVHIHGSRWGIKFVSAQDRDVENEQLPPATVVSTPAPAVEVEPAGPSLLDTAANLLRDESNG